MNCGATFDLGQETILEQHIKDCIRSKPPVSGTPQKPWKTMSREEKIAALEAADKRMVANREKAEKAQTKTLGQILIDTDKVLSAYVAALDCTVRFKKMTVEQFLNLPKNDVEITYMMVYYQLHNADESVTKEQVYKLSFDVADCIMNAMTEAHPFLNIASPKTLLEALKAEGSGES